MKADTTINKSLLTGLFWVLFLNLLIKPFWILGIEVGAQNAVGAAEYGLYITLFNIAYIFNILLDVGITNFNTRNIAQHPTLIAKYLSGILSTKMLLLVLYVVVTFTVGLLKGYDSRHFALLALLSLNQFLNSLILFLRSNYEGLLLFKWDSVISILDRVVMILICGCLLWLPNHPVFKIEYFVLAQTAAYIATAIVALAVLLKKVPLGWLHFSWPFTYAVLKQSLPFALLVLLMASYNRIDPILLEDLSTDGTFQAGIYAGAFRLLDALTMVAYLVSVPLLPIFSKLLAPGSEQPQQLKVQLRLVTSLMVLFSVTAAVGSYHAKQPLMQLLYHDNELQYARVFGILVFGIIPISMTYVYGTLLTAGGRLKYLNIMASITLAINIAVNLIAIPRYGAWGSAWASLIAQSFMALAQIIVALRIFNIIPSIGYILKLILFTLILVVSATIMPFSEWWACLSATAIIALLLAIVLRLINVKEIIKMLKNK